MKTLVPLAALAAVALLAAGCGSTKKATTTDMIASKTLLARADDLTPARFKTVMIPAMSAAHAMYGICGR